jgi:hypothetical protein
MLLKKHLRWIVVALVGTLVLAGTALAAKKSSLKVKAPTSVKVGTTYQVVTSGRAKGKANYVIGLAVRAPCKSNWTDEFSSVGRPSTVNLSRPVHRKFKKVRSIKAGSPGTVYWCAYLINKRTLKTYAHKSKHWTDVP